MPALTSQRTPTRIQLQSVSPQVDCGRYPAKATAGDDVAVSATIYRDGHDQLSAVERYRRAGARRWKEQPLVPVGNDRKRSLGIVTRDNYADHCGWHERIRA